MQTAVYSNIAQNAPTTCVVCKQVIVDSPIFTARGPVHRGSCQSFLFDTETINESESDLSEVQLLN
ncbi:hypothetical protein KNT64_gp146 [Pseudomonas phage PspYZU05]|uniref:Uncharacterized protein n=1 Tax=Pseudomonas phage PspYZU05 TaxID=1983556 RepID=A0A2U7NLW1_9CAUD|nr:hypothetical protein KNT64_gp146 [Pseudomonas phage PspYZU05]ASD52098.1 hypothetical protein PspYZU05_146 [Pseudomonas phage PspYZU05]